MSDPEQLVSEISPSDPCDLGKREAGRMPLWLAAERLLVVESSGRHPQHPLAVRRRRAYRVMSVEYFCRVKRAHNTHSYITVALIAHQCLPVADRKNSVGLKHIGHCNMTGSSAFSRLIRFLDPQGTEHYGDASPGVRLSNSASDLPTVTILDGDIANGFVRTDRTAKVAKVRRMALKAIID